MKVGQSKTLIKTGRRKRRKKERRKGRRRRRKSGETSVPDSCLTLLMGASQVNFIHFLFTPSINVKDHSSALIPGS